MELESGWNKHKLLFMETDYLRRSIQVSRLDKIRMRRIRKKMNKIDSGNLINSASVVWTYHAILNKGAYDWIPLGEKA